MTESKIEKIKKKSEKNDIEEFIKYSKIPLINIVEGKQIDFIANFDDKIIGIEHTMLCEENTKKYEQKIEKIISKAYEIYKNSTKYLPISVTILFKGLLKEHKTKNKEIIESICNLLYQNYENIKNNTLPHQLPSIKIKPDNDIYISSIFVYRICEKTMKRHNWRHAYAYRVKQSIYEDIKEAIEKKDKKIKQYINKEEIKIDKFYLIIVVNTGKGSSAYYYDNNLNLKKFTSKYDKVFVFDRIRKESIELAIV